MISLPYDSLMYGRDSVRRIMRGQEKRWKLQHRGTLLRTVRRGLSWHERVSWVERGKGWIYVLEMALKIYAYGFENYWRDGQNQFDFLIAWIIVIGETVTFASPQGSILSNGEWYETVDSIPSSCKNVAIDKAADVCPALQSLHSNILNSHTEFDAISRDTILRPVYVLLSWCAGKIYCSLDLLALGATVTASSNFITLFWKIFGGMVNAGNPKLEATGLADDVYLLLNFNDYPNGMVTLFNLLVMGNWQVWMQVIAFVLEAFFAELDLESSERGDERDKKSVAGRDRRRSVGYVLA
ncbi:Two pore calcium channel protein 1A [Morus notabilis]|uniref:Two pore calcium channel protein 1A n=1 Tax=Morus notabilis TaxID=981085 RepID=W9R4H6_9ROSA|nr:Two pore calcium channel protein 1A [Morus notabilis]